MTSSQEAIAATPGTSKGERTRKAILRTACDVASVEGIERLSIGRLADEVGMSKSGLYAHFGSRHALQVATIETALEVVAEEVVRPAMDQPKGLRRLWALCTGFLTYLDQEVFPGGCFFAAAQAELDACPGPLRDRVAALGRQWLARLEAEVQVAQERGELRSDLDPAQLAFELEALLFLASSARLLFRDDPRIIERAATGLRARLQRELTDPAAELL